MSEYFLKKDTIEPIHVKRESRFKKIAISICDALDMIWCIIRLHWILIFAFSISFYLMPYKFLMTSDIIYPILGMIIIMFGMALDNSMQYRGMY